MNYAVLESNTVINITVAEEDIAQMFGWIPEAANCIIGSSWDGVEFHLPEPPPPDYTDSNKQQAQSLLINTDWTEIPSVSDVNTHPHLLNTADFITYRNEIRVIAVNPPNTAITWPTVPTEQWSSVNT